MAAGLLEAVATGAAAVREEIQEEDKSCRKTTKVEQDGSACAVLYNRLYGSPESLVTILTDVSPVVVVYSVLFMDWKDEKQPFDEVQYYRKTHQFAMVLINHYTGSKMVLGVPGLRVHA